METFADIEIDRELIRSNIETDYNNELNDFKLIFMKYYNMVLKISKFILTKEKDNIQDLHRLAYLKSSRNLRGLYSVYILILSSSDYDISVVSRSIYESIYKTIYLNSQTNYSRELIRLELDGTPWTKYPGEIKRLNLRNELYINDTANLHNKLFDRLSSRTHGRATPRRSDFYYDSKETRDQLNLLLFLLYGSIIAAWTSFQKDVFSNSDMELSQALHHIAQRLGFHPTFLPDREELKHKMPINFREGLNPFNHQQYQ